MWNRVESFVLSPVSRCLILNLILSWASIHVSVVDILDVSCLLGCASDLQIYCLSSAFVLFEHRTVNVSVCVS